MGVGIILLYIFGFVYIDENVYLKLLLVYFVVFFFLILLGFGLGFIFGGLLLNIYIDVI